MEDPSADLCLLTSSFKGDTCVDFEKVSWYEHRYEHGTDRINLTAAFETVSHTSDQEILYCDANAFTVLQGAKDKFSDYEPDDFVKARNASNPFEDIGRSIFMNRAAIKLANIDAMLEVSTRFTFLQKQDPSAFTFCDVAAGPGGFTQYLQYRFPKGVGYGMTLRGQLDWRTKSLDLTRFYPYYGSDNTGNLYTHYDDFVQYISKEKPEGVDLVTADGGFDVEDTVSEGENLLSKQEFLSSRLFLTQAYVGISCTKGGGNFVLKSFGVMNLITAQILYILALAFERVCIFKPVTSRPANAECYIVCKRRRDQIMDLRTLLKNAAAAYTDTAYLNRIFEEELPEDFEDWLTIRNNEAIANQVKAVTALLFTLDNRSYDLPQYDIAKFLLIWNLPDTPDMTIDTEENERSKGAGRGRGSKRGYDRGSSRGYDRGSSRGSSREYDRGSSRGSSRGRGTTR
jgi:cap1 methyltransferase